MGYTTQFEGSFTIAPPLTVEQRRLFGDLDNMPGNHPDGYFQWEVDKEGAALRWDGEEKFYCYEEWLRWLVTDYFAPLGRTVFGEVLWQGEDLRDRGILSVVNGVVTATKDADRKPEGSADGKLAFLIDRIKKNVIPLIVEGEDNAALNELSAAIAKCEAP